MIGPLVFADVGQHPVGGRRDQIARVAFVALIGDRFDFTARVRQESDANGQQHGQRADHDQEQETALRFFHRALLKGS